ncbi:glycoside hydrolase family 127 protein [Anaerocolumna sp. AGMB13025]|uniref:glycoside hydrolase family 127 protein n=1 Tax=Anaerocolumna sp. AGMB13025 TaxID=3039116 RepID=UPI00241E1150|nr:beta-L-arabinofuranosidase domain-containing protein [Anaerocolumna sp. AGMB13025]WFR55761.1 glycoside hydrolase family 127 protein [Anaerocolumna sp. AGMB13025]
MIQSFSLSQVKLKEPYLNNAFQKELDYLMSFDCDRLLSNFRLTRGLTPKAKCYEGWEDTEIRGHSLGHYLTALAQAYTTTDYNNTIYKRLQYLMEELSLCQFQSGYLSAFPEEFFDRVETGKPVWVPWYTMHKIISGLVNVYNHAKLDSALAILSGIGDWVYNRSDKWTPQIHDRVLSVEYGGMNDCMYEVYKITQNENHAVAAHRFDEIKLFEPIHDGKDILNNRHANTTIPKFLGALNRYVVYGEKEAYYLTVCKQFWDIVTKNHSYITGGNSEWEHFGEPDILDAERTEANCETCNTYNMLKMTRTLFQITGDSKYSDFYETTFINAILSSQNPQTGMTTYFQPMATGYFKVYSKPFEHFWCCTGTGMENFSKLNDSFYFHEEDKLYVNMYFSSSVNWEEKKIRLSQDTNLLNMDKAVFRINTEAESSFTLCLRIPAWSEGTSIQINDVPASYTLKDGYACITRTWNDNDVIDMTFKTVIRYHELPDNKNAVAFTYGPVVLSAGLGTEELEESTTGVQVKIPKKPMAVKDYIVIRQSDIKSFKEHLSEHLVKTEGKMEFRLKSTDEDDRLIFTPHYQQHKERYGIYWILVEENSDTLNNYIKQKRHLELVKAAEIDSIQIGNDQYELSHNIQGKDTESGDRDGFHYRTAKAGGWFGYDLQVCDSEDTYLQFGYMPGDCKKGFYVEINNTELSHESMEGKSWRDITERSYLIPKELYQDSPCVTVKFRTEEEDSMARIIEVIKTSKKV